MNCRFETGETGYNHFRFPIPLRFSLVLNYFIMDALKAEIASKRKTLQDDSVESLRPTKYMRRGDIEKLREEQELKAREEREQKDIKERERVDQAASLKKAAKMKVCL